MTFPRSGSLLTDAPGLSCFTSSLLPYLNSSHSGASCGKEDGAWRLDEVTSADGRVLKYDYANGVLSSVTDQRYGNALLFEYEGHFGGIQFVNGQSGFDNPNDPLWLASAGDFSPDSASTHGQLSRLKTVKTNVTGGPEISFNYDDSVQRYSPLLASYIDPAGHYHAYEYEVLGVDQNGDRDAINLLKKFTPSSLTQSVFDISYSDSGRVTHLTDGSGRTVTYGINGARNRSVALDGSETVRLYDPEGNLREMISPSHEGAP